MTIIDTYQTQLEILGILAVALLLGGAIGLERELARKPAGLRTHMLVTGAAALFVALGTVIIEDYTRAVSDSLLRADPVRIMQAVVTGVSFLGAGTIMRDRSQGHIEGLTTAASLLIASAVGSTVGARQFVLAGGATVLILITLGGLGFIEKRLDSFATDSEQISE